MKRICKSHQRERKSKNLRSASLNSISGIHSWLRKKKGEEFFGPFLIITYEIEEAYHSICFDGKRFSKNDSF